MAKSEILMWVAGIMMMIILGLAVAPTVTKSGDTARIAVVNSELNALRNTSMLWVAQNSPDGTFAGITSTLLQTYLPGMTLTGGKLVSKANASIQYAVTVKTGDASQLTITIQGLDAIEGAEASVKTSQTSIAAGVTDASATDGILAIDYRG